MNGHSMKKNETKSILFSLFGFGVRYPFKTDVHLKVKKLSLPNLPWYHLLLQECKGLDSLHTRKSQDEQIVTISISDSLRRSRGARLLTACLAWMLAAPSLRMVLNTGLRVLKTSSLSIPDPSWMHRRHASEAAAHCSTPLPGLQMQTANLTFCTEVMATCREKSLFPTIWNHKWSQPFFKQRSMLSVIVILLSEMNS